MPRQSRLDATGILHHVIIRGIERRKIFLNDNDRNDFLGRCAAIFPETKTSCYAFALMPNHVHLLLRTGLAPLSTVMARLLTGYAVHFNRAYRRHGQLFQNRYKSIICQEDAYLKELVRYIHLNPVKARIVEGLEGLASYPYCGHGPLMGKITYPWQDDRFILSLFGPSEGEARRAYHDFLREGLTQKRRVDLDGGGLIRSHGGWAEIMKSRERMKGDVRVLGDSQFVLTILSQAEEKLEHCYRLKAKGIDLSFVEARVLEVLRISRDDLYSRGRQKRSAEGKGLLSFFAVRELGMSQTQLSELLNMTQPGVAAAVARGEKLARENGYTLLPDSDGG
jgi:putative transposase